MIYKNNKLTATLSSLHQCRKKVRYTTRIDADLAIARIWAEKQRDLVKYTCPWCYDYHLTKGKWAV